MRDFAVQLLGFWGLMLMRIPHQRAQFFLFHTSKVPNSRRQRGESAQNAVARKIGMRRVAPASLESSAPFWIFLPQRPKLSA